MAETLRRTRRPGGAACWLGASALLAACWLGASTLLAGCGGAPADPDPPGAWWVGRAPAVAGVLDQLGRLGDTPLARSARQLRAILPGCDLVGARADEADFAQLVVETRCVAPDDALADAWRRAGAEVAFALPVAGSQRARGTLELGPDALVVGVSWPKPDPDGALALLVPGDAPAGPDRLASAGRLVHARVRPGGGIDLDALVPADSQGDRLFALRGKHLAGALLDGTWEGAVYLPEHPGGMPGVALALGFRVKRAAVAAAERFVADLEQTWRIQRSPFQLDAGEGACLPGLNVLPDLAPCYVATDDALVVGWNPASLHRALAGVRADAPEAPGRVEVDLALIERADVWMAEHLATAEIPLRWPWRRLDAAGGLEGDALVWRLTLRPAPRAGT